MDEKLKGLGGWLILVGIGVVFAPIRMFIQLVPMYREIFSDGVLEALTTPGSEAFTPGFMPFLVFELSGNGLVFLASLWLIYLFFSKSYLFPRVYIAIATGSFLFIIVDTLIAARLFPEFPVFDPDTMREIARSVFTVVIWVPYMLLSRRVKLTFVEERSAQPTVAVAESSAGA